MNRITYMELAGKKYPLVFSLGAAKKIAEKYGDLEKLDEALSLETVDAETLDMLGYALAVLMQQGCAYKNKFEKDLPPEPDAHMEDGKYITLTQEEIETCVGFGSEQMTAPILEALGRSMDTELETESKNEGAPKDD